MTTKRYSFKSQTQKILHLVTHSLYSNKDIFLRELISNASDSIDKLRFESLKNPSLLKEDTKWKIEIRRDEQKRILSICDNGMGMNHDDLIKNLGTIAQSGTQEFLKLSQSNEDAATLPELIGQFGVGFYSAFMVADKIVVRSRKVGEPNGYLWTCHGEEEFDLEPIDKKYHGTDIILYLKEDSYDYLEEFKIRNLVKKYSDYIAFPITMDVEQKVDSSDSKIEKSPSDSVIRNMKSEVLNSQKAIWLKDKKEISPEEYQDFYAHLSHDIQPALKHLHFKVEGTTEFNALIYIPSVRQPAVVMDQKRYSQIHLYVKRVFILKDETELLLPPYLRFISGVVDSSDLPLNVSRELLQQNRVLKTISKTLISKILAALKQIKDTDLVAYKDFYKQFSIFLKEGLCSDFEHKNELLDLLLFHSTHSTGDEMISLKDYVDRMQSQQNKIYYISGDSISEVSTLFHLEIFKKKNYEVLYFIDPVDEFVVQSVNEYQGHSFRSVQRGEIDVDDDTKQKIKEATQKFSTFNTFAQETLSDYIDGVRLSTRLVDQPCCLVEKEVGLSSQMEKILKSYHQDVPTVKRILEINPEHALIKNLALLFDQNPAHPKLKDWLELLYEQAMISEGSKVSSPKKLVQKINGLLVDKLDLEMHSS